MRGPGKRNGLCRGSELCGVVEGSGRGMMGEDEAGGVVGDSGLTRLTCLPDGACLGRLRGQVYTLERSMRRRE